MCCPGCQAVAQAIVDANMTEFYQYRDTPNTTAKQQVPEFLQQLQAYDHPQIQKQFVRCIDDDNNYQQATLILEGIVCAACVWLNERHLQTLPGVISAQINYSNHRAQVSWDPARIKLSDILAAISQIGYFAHPYDPSKYQQILEQQRKQDLRRLGLAGALGMQIMVMAVALYTGGWWGMEVGFKQLFQYLSFFLTIPILLFAASPLFFSAWRDIKRRQLGMDVPISLGISIAFIGSSYATWYGVGEVYYDSISMFVFFVLAVRYFERAAHKKMSEASETLIQARPAMANRINPQQRIDIVDVIDVVPVAELNINDRVLIHAGETVPADGVIEQGQSTISEALLSGESTPLPKGIDDVLIGGSINIDSPLHMRVTQIGENTVLAGILRLLDKAQNEKPQLALLADKVAAHFVLVILVLASAVSLYGWLQHDPHWLSTLIAVLVVTCPCALSLATPAAISAATGQLSQRGLLITGKAVLETLAQTTHIVFDKTGTLTEGQLIHQKTILLDRLDDQQAQQLALSLEQGSKHPIAKVLSQFDETPLVTKQLHYTAGGGIQAQIDGQDWWLGHWGYLKTHCPALQHNNQAAQALLSGHPDYTLVYLANAQKIQAAFLLSDQLRSSSASLIKQLQAQGQQIIILSGDRRSVTEGIAKQLGIQHVHAELSPAQKLAQLQAYQQQGFRLAMVGDGINDAPVLAAAPVSIALSSGTQLAAASADILLLSNDLNRIAEARVLSQKTLRIIKQNLIWALSYNSLAVPLALMGYIAPWLAALGMSLSSFIVVANALRLKINQGK